MTSFFKFDTVGVKTVIKNSKQKRNKYNSDIVKLKTLIDEISTSTLWKDIAVKTEFINQMNLYIKTYEDNIIKIDNYIKYLENKAEDIIDMEYNYSKEN